MYRLDFFNKKQEKIKYILPFGRLHTYRRFGRDYVICFNKDGSMQLSMSYYGPDRDSTISEQLSLMTERLNTLFMGFGSSWVFYFEAQRKHSRSYDTDVYFPDDVTKAIDIERKNLFSSGFHFESNYFITCNWLPPKDRVERVKEFLIEGKEHKEIDIMERADDFIEQIEKVISAYRSVGVPIVLMNMSETLSYLHSTVSTGWRKINVPQKPLLLDHYLYDEPLYGGLEPKLGRKHFRIISPLTFPNNTIFGMFYSLNSLNFTYRWVTRFCFLSKQDSLSELDSIQRGWKGKMKSLMSTVKDLIYDRDSSVDINKNAAEKFNEVADAISACEADRTRYGFYTMSIMVSDRDADRADEKAKIVRQQLVDVGLTAKIEELNSVDAWLGMVPGNIGNNVRHPVISTANLVHMIPLSSVWPGPETNRHLKGPALLYTQTYGNTPFRLNLHIGDVGHAIILGPTGAGKSVHLNMIAASFRKYRNARIFIFDKGGSSKILTYGVGGQFYDLGSEESTLQFQPLAHVDDEMERQWALEWLCDYIREENIEINPDLKGMIRNSLGSLAAMPEDLRTITAFIDNLQDKTLKTAFSALSLADEEGNPGEYGKMFDANKDSLSISDWQTFEMEKLMNTKAIVGPTLMYIFHRIEQSLTGDPTIIILDECWVFFDNPMFAEKIREWLKVLRKANASVVFATQSPEDVANSPIFSTIVSACQSRIFLPDVSAMDPAKEPLYRSFGLNKRKLEIIAKAQKKKQYYYDSQEGSRLYDLALENCPVTLSYVAVDKKDQKRCQQIISEYGAEYFNVHWLKEHGLHYPEDVTESKVVI